MARMEPKNEGENMKQGVDYIGVSVGALIFNDTGKILLLKRSQNAKNEKGKWEAPGGAVDFWEKREDAIKREAKEELGIKIEIVGLLDAVDELLRHDKQHWVSTPFICRIKRGKPRIMEPNKFDDIGWFKLSNLPKPLSYISAANVEAYKKRLRR